MTQHAQHGGPMMTLPECAEVEETASPMRSHASTATICGYLSCCAQPFTPRKHWQLYCSDECRLAQHRLRHDGGLRGIVRSVKRLKGGRVSITLHLDDIDAALRVEPGRVMEILDRDGAAIGGELPKSVRPA